MDVFNLLVNSDLLYNTPNLNNEKEQLIKYKKLIKNNKATVNYIKCKGIKYGRVNPKNGLGMHYMRKEIRHTLLKDLYVDVDIVNCHPTILYQICKKKILNVNI